MTQEPTNSEVATLCYAEAFCGAQEECQRLRAQLAQTEAEAAAMREAIDNLLRWPGNVVPNRIDSLFDKASAATSFNAGRELLERLRAAEERADKAEESLAWLIHDRS